MATMSRRLKITDNTMDGAVALAEMLIEFIALASAKFILPKRRSRFGRLSVLPRIDPNSKRSGIF